MKNKIEINILVFVLIEALFLLLGLRINIINLFLGTILGIIFIFLLSKIKNNIIMAIILLLVAIYFSFITVIKIGNFITYNLLKNYSLIIIIISFLILSLFLAKKNYHSFIRSLEISFYFFIIFKTISLLLIIPNIKLTNINILLLAEIKPNVSLIYVGLTIFFIQQLIYYLTNHITTKKIFIISIINPILMKLVMILAIGRTLFYLYKYPYVNIFKGIKYFDFIERMEGLLSFEYMISFFFLLSFFLLFIINTTKKLLKSIHQ